MRRACCTPAGRPAGRPASGAPRAMRLSQRGRGAGRCPRRGMGREGPSGVPPRRVPRPRFAAALHKHIHTHTPRRVAFRRTRAADRARARQLRRSYRLGAPGGDVDDVPALILLHVDVEPAAGERHGARSVPKGARGSARAAPRARRCAAVAGARGGVFSPRLPAGRAAGCAGARVKWQPSTSASCCLSENNNAYFWKKKKKVGGLGDTGTNLGRVAHDPIRSVLTPQRRSVCW